MFLENEGCRVQRRLDALGLLHNGDGMRQPLVVPGEAIGLEERVVESELVAGRHERGLALPLQAGNLVDDGVDRGVRVCTGLVEAAFGPRNHARDEVRVGLDQRVRREQRDVVDFQRLAERDYSDCAAGLHRRLVHADGAGGLHSDRQELHAHVAGRGGGGDLHKPRGLLDWPGDPALNVGG